MAELLVVVGVLALLLAMTSPALHLARRQAQQACCAANLQQLAVSLSNVWTDFDYYPIWDDADGPVRYTWIDVLIQVEVFSNYRGGYCPADARPDAANQARAQVYGLFYPPGRSGPGVDYSYGIAVPMSAGGWAWRPVYAPAGDDSRRVFEGHERWPAQRVLAGDAYWPAMYNFSGHVFNSGAWNDPTYYDNTVAYRHANTANVLMHDGHVRRITYGRDPNHPVDTARYFFWHPGESVYLGPWDRWDDNYYPYTPPVRYDKHGRYEGDYPLSLLPWHYTRGHAWTQIRHKGY